MRPAAAEVNETLFAIARLGCSIGFLFLAPGRRQRRERAILEKTPERMPWGLVASLSMAQLISWGSVFYAFTLFIEPMMDELGWTKPALTAAFSLGLVASGLAAVPVGRLIDRGFGRSVMTGGSLLAAMLLALWSGTRSYSVFLVLWVGLGATLSAILYEPGFAVLTRRLGPLSRRGITAMTLVGGLASTVFIPLTHLLIEQTGWRRALLALAAFNGLCALIHALAIPRESGHRAIATPPLPQDGAARSSPRRVLRQPAFWGFVITSILHGALFTGFAVHLIPLLVERGFSLDTAVAVFSLVGPAQVGARVLMAMSERILSIRTMGLVTTALPVLAFGILTVVEPDSWTVVLFALLYGAANGLMTIVRAVLPPEIFGREDYGVIQGMIAAPATFSRAAAPFAFGAIWALSGSYGFIGMAALVMAGASVVCFATTVLPSRDPGGPRPSRT